ncbi:MAG TPA: DmsC/YnfH family molybdoenzyme membrane anchor subunit [Caldimonas sp.]|nr:DmsC/YnfH family molybdoenzyme membrane anchor subunit [Caldimonas sp.]
MNPAFSVVVFTTVAGAAQGLVVALAIALLAGTELATSFVRGSLLVAIVLLVVGLGSSFLHLGRPLRAWRAAAMWRTSWLSREVIVLPTFIVLVGLWWLAAREPVSTPARLVLPLAAIAVAALLWYCTAMIYACLRFIEEWAQPLTILNFVLLGLSSGCVLASALAALASEAHALALAAPLALVVTLVAWASRAAAWRRNAALRHRSTLQSATGIRSARLVQTSMGMSAGSFNTREFFHRASASALRNVKGIAIVLGFAVPAVVIAGVVAGALPSLACVAALLVQAPGLIADRWLFFAQAKHPQNLYYQVVS